MRYKMRFYGYGNYYLSSLQQGLQAGHCVAELFVKYVNDKQKLKTVFDWAKDHKTKVLLNGGNSGSLANIHGFFESLVEKGMDLPFVKFHEDEESLNGALTYVAMIVPQEIYEMSFEIKEKTYMGNYSDDSWQYQLAQRMTMYELAK